MNLKRLGLLVAIFAFVVVATFANPPSAGMYKCNDTSFKWAYVKITYSTPGRYATIKWYDSNKNQIRGYDVSRTADSADYNSTNDALWIRTSSASVPTLKQVSENTISLSGSKTYVRVHDFNYDE